MQSATPLASRRDAIAPRRRVAVFFGERSGGIRTYLDAKAAFAARSGAVDHHLIVPGRTERHAGGRHELPGIPLARSNGYRLPLGGAALVRTLRAIPPDIMLLHDPWWAPVRAARTARALGGVAGIVHHCSIGHAARAVPLPELLAKPFLRAWSRRVYRRVGLVVSAVDPEPDVGVPAAFPLRLALDAAFRPRPDVERGDHVLYAGRLSREKGVVELVAAAAAASWPLTIVGAGPSEGALRRRVARLGLAGRVSFRPFVADRRALALEFARARCVAVPGRFDTFGLVVLEAAATGTPVAACATSPAARAAGSLASRFDPDEPSSLGRAIEAALAAAPDSEAGTALGERFTWERAFQAELAACRALAGGPTACQ